MNLLNAHDMPGSILPIPQVASFRNEAETEIINITLTKLKYVPLAQQEGSATSQRPGLFSVYRPQHIVRNGICVCPTYGDTTFIWVPHCLRGSGSDQLLTAVCSMSFT